MDKQGRRYQEWLEDQLDITRQQLRETTAAGSAMVAAARRDAEDAVRLLERAYARGDLSIYFPWEQETIDRLVASYSPNAVEADHV